VDQALNRTRRNLIGVSVALALLYAFGWEFPSELRIFGTVLSTNADAVMFIAWVSLAYFFWEYLVHVRPKFQYISAEWGGRFIQAHKMKIKQNMVDKYDSTALNDRLSQSKNKGYDSVVGVHDVGLTEGSRRLFWREIRVTTVIEMRKGNNSSNVPFDEPESYRAYYLLRSLPQFIRASIVCVTTSDTYFEHLIPLAFPFGAVLAAAFGPFQMLGSGDAATPAHGFGTALWGL